ncbi:MULTISPECIES: nitrous oxide-stimulated promoter family protein [unclassified Dehalobacter]|jgi:hypothetical protein|uniref:nitrous oxide-stimulated promoter family protein n=1 Tax=unclassified Dehalobacter TaxID=2635733 RepID=UPI0009DB0172|nr:MULTISPECIES: nitrous oxide-stimulated promoter family protein [unclassified Dehalobacter]
MSTDSKRRRRERVTVEKMINIYCKKTHTPQNRRCEDCERLYKYSSKKIEQCMFGENKPVCARCKIHCYKLEMRVEIKKVMRYSGPRMLFKHPILTLYHIIDSKRSNRKA